LRALSFLHTRLLDSKAVASTAAWAFSNLSRSELLNGVGDGRALVGGQFGTDNHGAIYVLV
jgi:hypothetical protein